MKKNILLLLILVLLISCESTTDLGINNEEQPIKLTAVQKMRMHQDNNFSFDFLKTTITNSDEPNVFVSPMSVSMVFGMLINGAYGQTSKEIQQAFNMENLTHEEVNNYYKVMLEKLPGLDSKTNLKMANAIWLRENFNVKNKFTDINKKYFNAYIKSLDFNQQWAVDTINNWAKRNTDWLIPKVIKEIPNGTVAYLMNALYFKGEWTTQFDNKATRVQDFTNEAGKSLKVNMMNKTDTLAYTSDDNAQYLKIPYGNASFNMTIILPKEGKTITESLENLNAEKLDLLTESMRNLKVNLFLPRFKVKQKLELNDVLNRIEIKSAFNETADFTGISNARPLFISKVNQDTYIEVTEEGTKAAAVTTVGMTNTSLPPGNQYITFMVNRPFIFLIREESTGAILFIGKIGSVEKF